ncbi:S41 family peptidase [Streptacidiphilus sp. EB129]|uniref:S41 family peptidase n=1 Tax=Streptacidiphilus sp. EB129 TaxID=3156262 RepID=UPI003512F1FA
MSGTYPHIRLHLALGLVFGAVLAAGATTGAWGSQSPPVGQPVSVQRRLSDDAARSWVAQSGDRWAAFYTAQQYARVSESLAGRYVGVGLWVTRTPDGVDSVTAVRAGSPAAGAGVRPGERLLTVDGRQVTGLPVTDVVALLRGDGVRGGSPVTLTLQRAGGVRAVTLHRQLLDADDVVLDHPARGVTRIVVSAFTTGVGDQVEAALRQNAGRSGTGILLDLRGNSGGLVDEAVETASAFLDGGPVASYQADGAAVQLTAEPGGDTGTPLVVLVDGGTMSAAELLTGALQDRGRAVVVGSRTFGKGAVQQPTTLADGSVLERTVGHYRTPAGHDPDGTGITPDITVPPSAGPQAAESTAIEVLDGLAGTTP